MNLICPPIQGNYFNNFNFFRTKQKSQSTIQVYGSSLMGKNWMETISWGRPFSLLWIIHVCTYKILNFTFLPRNDFLLVCMKIHRELLISIFMIEGSQGGALGPGL